MSHFACNTEFHVINCWSCAGLFAITDELYNRRRKDHQAFWCANCGKAQYYMGKTPEQEKLDEAQRQVRTLESKVVQAERRAEAAQRRASAVNKQYKRIRDRVKNGVCPCCNRTFGNLANHMRTQHPDFGSGDLLKTLREALGLTQTALAEEVWTKPAYISMYERGKPVPERAKEDIESWLTAQTA